MSDAIGALLVLGVPFACYKMLTAALGPREDTHTHREIAVGKEKGRCRCGLPMRLNKPSV